MTLEAKWSICPLKLKRRSEVTQPTLEFRFDKSPRITFKDGNE